jgi:hypothetical protein
MSPLVEYLMQRPEALGLIAAADLDRTVIELFGRHSSLPQPYKIFFNDEAQPPILGFPIHETPVLLDLDAKLDRWLNEETRWQMNRDLPKERVLQAFNAYITSVIKYAENAIVSNLLADYHAIFWLAHSLDVSRQFAALPRRVSAIDTQVGRTQGDLLKYRIYARWSTEIRDQVTALGTRVAVLMDGEQERTIAFLRALLDNVLIFTEEFIGPDLREMRSFLVGYLRKDFTAFRESFERLRTLGGELMRADRVFRSGVAALGFATDTNVSVGMMLNRRFQRFLLEHPAAEPIFTRDEREQLAALSRRLVEFAVFHQLRRGMTWMTTTSEGAIVSPDRRGTTFSRSTRPIDFGRPGVVDPMVYRFGLMYDIAAFSETLGNLARAGRKGEMNSYRQMVLFQRRVEAIAERHRLQFEKFLGDGAFYTTRRALRLVRAAVEIQRFYSEMKRKGFAFDKGMRVALNYGYYRLLPMKPATVASQQVMEFYGPGIVELSRLTTGKAAKEIEEIQGFLISHGYETSKVQQFFAPLARGVDMIDHKMHEREFYAYVNSSGHLVNEGIVASLSLLQELSAELPSEELELYRIDAGWGRYVGFRPSIEGFEYIGLRLIGSVSLKGLDSIEVGEVVPFVPGEVRATPVDRAEPLVTLLRAEYHGKYANDGERSQPIEHIESIDSIEEP